MPERSDFFDDNEIVKTILIPLFSKYQELRWFADEKVWVTQEASTDEEKPGWTQHLVALKLIPPQGKNKKYGELERTLSSIVCLHLIIDGSDKAYNRLISQQNKKEVLHQETFNKLHQFAKSLINSTSTLSAVESLLVYSDLGKTPNGAIQAKKILKHVPTDHDDFADAVLNNHNPELIVPSFGRLHKDTQKIIKSVAKSLRIHLGHFLHLEGGVAMFDRLMLNLDVLSTQVINIAFLVQICDVAASRGHLSNKGSLALTEKTYAAYDQVYNSLITLTKNRNPKMLLISYINMRAQNIGLNEVSNVKLKQLLTRIACMLRLYNENDGSFILAEFINLSQEYKNLLLDQFSMFVSGINVWKRNPTYIPAVIINLFDTYNQNERQAAIKAAIAGLVCIAQCTKLYAANNEFKLSETPLCFNTMATLAKTNPNYFNPDSFSPSAFSLDGRQNLVLSQPSSKDKLRPLVKTSLVTESTQTLGK